MKNLTPPFINMNGDSKENLNAQLMTFFRSLDECTQNLAKCEYNNGRNATDREHNLKMREEKAEILQLFHETKQQFVEMFKEINEKNNY